MSKVQQDNFPEELQSLKCIEQRLLESNNELSHFAHRVAHDLKAPLRSLNIYLYLIKKQLADNIDDKLIEYIRDAELTTKRMGSQIDGVLDYAEFSKPNHFDESIDIERIVDSIRDDFKADIIDKNAEVSLVGKPVITGNYTLIRQLFYNLMSNALKYSCNGESSPKICITMKETKKYWRFSIKDNGIGIEESYHEKIFQPFERLHDRLEYEGRGLGLDICRQVIKLHEGKIWLDSKVDKGSNFQFTVSKQLS